MSTKLILGLVGVLAVVAGGIYWLAGSEDNTEQARNTENEEIENAAGNFATLARSGQNLHCTFQYNDGENVSSGEVYMTAGAERIRGDFNITESAIGQVEMHLIRDGGRHYLWGSALEQGIMTAVPNDEVLFEQDENSPVDENTEYECVAWRVDDSKFSLPVGVEFQDMTIFQSGINASGSAGAAVDMKTQQCAACAMVQDADAAAQCRTAFQCE